MSQIIHTLQSQQYVLQAQWHHHTGQKSIFLPAKDRTASKYVISILKKPFIPCYTKSHSPLQFETKIQRNNALNEIERFTIKTKTQVACSWLVSLVILRKNFIFVRLCGGPYEDCDKQESETKNS